MLTMSGQLRTSTIKQLDLSNPQQSITKSINFIKKMTVLSLSSITFQRKIFGKDAYEDRQWGKRRIKFLKGNDENSKRMMTWIKSALKMIDLRYLRKLIFVIEEEGKEFPNETYTIRFTYEDEEIMWFMETTGNNSDLEIESSGKSQCPSEVRKQVDSLLKLLESYTSKLPHLPHEYDVSIKLEVNDSVPPDFEPPFPFKVVDSLGIQFPPEIQTTNLGGAETKFSCFGVTATYDNPPRVDEVDELMEEEIAPTPEFEQAPTSLFRYSSGQSYLCEIASAGSLRETPKATHSNHQDILESCSKTNSEGPKDSSTEFGNVLNPSSKENTEDSNRRYTSSRNDLTGSKENSVSSKVADNRSISLLENNWNENYQSPNVSCSKNNSEEPKDSLTKFGNVLNSRSKENTGDSNRCFTNSSNNLTGIKENSVSSKVADNRSKSLLEINGNENYEPSNVADTLCRDIFKSNSKGSSEETNMSEAVSVSVREKTLKCICKKDDDLLETIKCTSCCTFQHKACYKLLEHEAVKRHVCVSCHKPGDENLICTNPDLLYENDVEETMYRRALSLCESVKKVSINTFVTNLNITRKEAMELFQKLNDDGCFILDSKKRNIRIVNMEHMTERILPLHFNTSELKCAASSQRSVTKDYLKRKLLMSEAAGIKRNKVI